jgi:hypothetical protein
MTLGNRVEEVHAGDMIFIPRDTWIGAENIGTEHINLTSVYSAPGYEEYLRAVSVIVVQPVAPLWKGELDEIRKKHVHDGIYPP